MQLSLISVDEKKTTTYIKSCDYIILYYSHNIGFFLYRLSTLDFFSQGGSFVILYCDGVIDSPSVSKAEAVEAGLAVLLMTGNQAIIPPGQEHNPAFCYISV